MMKDGMKKEIQRLLLRTAFYGAIIVVGVVVGWVAALGMSSKAEASSCYSGSLMAYVDSRIPTAKTDRWERIKAALLEQPGAMPLAEAEAILENRKRQRLFLEYMDEVVAAIKCLAAEPEIDTQVVVVDPPDVGGGAEDPGSGTAPTWPGPQPQEDAQDQSPVDNTSLRTYFHIEPLASTSNDYRINEDDHWEADLILHYESNQDLPDDPLALSGIAFCINQDLWGGPDYWHNGPITLPGFTQVADKTALPTILPQHGLWRCTDGLDVEPNTNVIDDNGDGDTTVEVVYRAKVRTRDNNVVEDDFRVTDLQFRVLDTFSGSTIWRTETEGKVDRDSWWRMNRDEVAWPDYPHTEFALGDGSSWNLMRRDDTTCGEVANSRWTDRADVSTGTYVQDLVRANDETLWLLDHCFPTVQVPKIPPTPPNTQPTTHDDTSLPIIEEDDVSYVKLHKVNGKWTVSLSKSVMVTDGTGWDSTSHGLNMNLGSLDLQARNILIPAENGIVKDKDFLLDDLVVMDSNNPPPTGIETFAEQCGKSKIVGGLGGAFHLNTSATNYVVNEPLISLPIDTLSNSLRHYKRSLRLELPPRGSNLCN